jgi:hypothetical protein
MAFSPFSFLLGLGAGVVLPVISRGFRPLAVEATAFGLGFIEDARRIVAEQMENLEDIAAEGRARRAQIIIASMANGRDPDEDAAQHAEARAETAVNGGGARRRSARGRSRAS